MNEYKVVFYYCSNKNEIIFKLPKNSYICEVQTDCTTYEWTENNNTFETKSYIIFTESILEENPFFQNIKIGGWNIMLITSSLIKECNVPIIPIEDINKKTCKFLIVSPYCLDFYYIIEKSKSSIKNIDEADSIYALEKWDNNKITLKYVNPFAYTMGIINMDYTNFFRFVSRDDVSIEYLDELNYGIYLNTVRQIYNRMIYINE